MPPHFPTNRLPLRLPLHLRPENNSAAARTQGKGEGHRERYHPDFSRPPKKRSRKYGRKPHRGKETQAREVHTGEGSSHSEAHADGHVTAGSQRPAPAGLRHAGPKDRQHGPGVPARAWLVGRKLEWNGINRSGIGSVTHESIARRVTIMSGTTDAVKIAYVSGRATPDCSRDL